MCTAFRYLIQIRMLFGLNRMSHGLFKLKHILKDLTFVFKKSKYDRKIYGC